MKINRILTKMNKKGFPSETTEQNERLKIWLTFIGVALSTLLAAVSQH